MKLSRTLINCTGWTTLMAFASTSFLSVPLQAAPEQKAPAAAGQAWTPPTPIRSSEARSVALKETTPPDFPRTLREVPDVKELKDMRALQRPLVAKPGRSHEASQRRDLARALEQYVARAQEKHSVRLQPLLDYVQAHPNTPFAGTLWLEISLVATSTADFELALDAGKKSWEAMKDIAEPAEALEEAEQALGNLLQLYTRLGQRRALSDLLTEIMGRKPHVTSSSRVTLARSALATWAEDPDLLALCGIYAYNELAQRLGSPLLQKPTEEWSPAPAAELAARRSELSEKGMSAARLAALVRQSGSDWRWIKRTKGSVIPVPSVVHLQFGGEAGHYSALIEGHGDDTQLVDTYLRLNTRVENKTLSRQSSGYFMVPSSMPLPEGFVETGAADLDSIFGSLSCPSGRHTEGTPPPPCPCQGMAVASIHPYFCSLIVQDQPLTYRPLYGPWLDLTILYQGVQPNLYEDFTADTSNFGLLWHHSLLSYVKADSGLPLPNIYTAHVFADGTYYEYPRNGAAYVSTYVERPALTWLTTGGPGYRLTYSDGSFKDFTQPNGASPTRYYLKRVVDAQGYILTLAYDSSFRISTITDATGKVTTFGYSGASLKIQSITDPFGRSATFDYDVEGRLTKITDPVGIESEFQYFEFWPELIEKITTPYGTQTVGHENLPDFVMSYGSGWAITLTDPQGFTERAQSIYHDAVTLFTWGANAEPRPPSTISVNGTNVSFLNTVAFDDHFHTTMRWNKKQWYHFSKAKEADPNANPQEYAEYILWIQRGSASANVPIATKKQGESAVWYNYLGQTVSWQLPQTGGSTLPIKAARQIEDEQGMGGNLVWVMTQQAYNAQEMPTVQTDEMGRKTQILYAVNNQDPTTVQALTTPPSTWSTLKSYGSYALHLPGTVTAPSGLVTTYSRNAKSQVTQVQLSKSTNIERTRYTYSASGTAAPAAWPGAPGFLRKIERSNNAAGTTFVTTDQLTYDSVGRLHTHTDANGYVRTFDYDDLDRPTVITHPDGTTEQFSYLRGDGAGGTQQSLDLTATKDRAGRWTRTLYSPRRQPVTQITPEGRITQMEWCLCGQLQKLIDPLGRVTKWTWNIAGQNLEKIMPDGIKKTTYTYEPRSGRMSSKATPNLQGANLPQIFKYYLDGRLRIETNVLGQNETSYGYETNAPGRLTAAASDFVVHAFSYVPFNNAAANAGEGMLQYADGPFSNDRIQYVYDWQDRVATENLIPETATTPLYRTESYTWDTLGRPKTVVNPIGTFTYGYTTNLPRPDSLTRPNSISTAYTYNANTAPGDSAGKLASITHTRSAVQQAGHIYGYDVAGRITSWEQQSISQPNMKTDYSYNLDDELVQAIDTNLTTSTVVDTERWGLDDGGNLLSRSRIPSGLMETRTVDVMNRLTQIGGAGSTVVEGTVNEFATVTVNGQPAEMKSDPAAGNFRFKKMVPVTQGSNTVTISATDTDTPPEVTTQNWQFNVPAVSRSFTYDQSGNTLTDGIRTMTWDVKNRLKTVTVGANTWKWDYDYQGRRVREYLNNVEIKGFIWSGDRVIQETVPDTPTATRTHLFGGFSDGAPGFDTEYHTFTDHLGNVREVEPAATATVAARYDYTPYQGPVAVGTPTVTPTFLTIGAYYHHAGSGLELALYRAYDAELGRWMSEDPIGEQGGVNLYEYADNQPVIQKDPLGLTPFKPLAPPPGPGMPSFRLTPIAGVPAGSPMPGMAPLGNYWGYTGVIGTNCTTYVTRNWTNYPSHANMTAPGSPCKYVPTGPCGPGEREVLLYSSDKGNHVVSQDPQGGGYTHQAGAFDPSIPGSGAIFRNAPDPDALAKCYFGSIGATKQRPTPLRYCCK